jgi:hypothetical protein
MRQWVGGRDRLSLHFKEDFRMKDDSEGAELGTVLSNEPLMQVERMLDCGRPEQAGIVAEIYSWVGQHILSEELLLDVEYPEAVYEVPASASGVVVDIMVCVGEQAKHGTPIVTLLNTESHELCALDDNSLISRLLDGFLPEHDTSKPTELPPPMRPRAIYCHSCGGPLASAVCAICGAFIDEQEVWRQGVAESGSQAGGVSKLLRLSANVVRKGFSTAVPIPDVALAASHIKFVDRSLPAFLARIRSSFKLKTQDEALVWRFVFGLDPEAGLDELEKSVEEQIRGPLEYLGNAANATDIHARKLYAEYLNNHRENAEYLLGHRSFDWRSSRFFLNHLYLRLEMAVRNAGYPSPVVAVPLEAMCPGNLWNLVHEKVRSWYPKYVARFSHRARLASETKRIFQELQGVSHGFPDCVICSKTERVGPSHVEFVRAALRLEKANEILDETLEFGREFGEIWVAELARVQVTAAWQRLGSSWDNCNPEALVKAIHESYDVDLHLAERHSETNLKRIDGTDRDDAVPMTVHEYAEWIHTRDQLEHVLTIWMKQQHPMVALNLRLRLGAAQTVGEAELAKHDIDALDHQKRFVERALKAYRGAESWRTAYYNLVAQRNEAEEEEERIYQAEQSALYEQERQRDMERENQNIEESIRHKQIVGELKGVVGELENIRKVEIAVAAGVWVNALKRR